MISPGRWSFGNCWRVNFIVLIIVSIDLAKSFGRGTGFGIGLAFLAPIFAMILGFGSDTYKGPAAKAA